MPRLQLRKDVIRPTGKQKEFLKAIRKHRYVLYGGARGGGKSYILRWALVELLLEWWIVQKLRNVTVGLFCEDYPSLYDRHVQKIKTEFPDWLGKLVGDEFRMSSELGSGMILLRNLDRPEKYLSAEFAAIAIDEITRNQVEVFDRLRGSLRWPGVEKPKFLCASNPGGPGHLWVKSYFKEQRLPPELEDQAKQFTYIKALPTDNPYLTAAYLAELRSLPPNLMRAYFEGDWDVFEGMVFEEWRDNLHVRAADFQPPSRWRFGGGMDWGYREPGCFVLFASGPDGDCVAVDEFYFKQQHGKEVGYRIGLMCLAVGPEPVEYIACDEQMAQETGISAPTIWEEVQSGIVEAYADNVWEAPKLVGPGKGPGFRATKLAVMHRYLAWDGDPDELKPWQRPLLTFTKACPNCIRTIPVLPYLSVDRKYGNPEDVDTHSEDHAYDAVTSYLMSRPPLAQGDPRLAKDHHPGFSGGKRRKWEENLREKPQSRGFQVPRTLVEVQGWD